MTNSICETPESEAPEGVREAAGQGFTPGPWEVVQQCSPIYNQLIGLSASEYGHVGVVAKYHTAKPSQWKANASLIAAAPELFKVLSHLSAEVDGLRVFEDGLRDVMGNTNWSVLRNWVAQAEAVLLKAEGGEQ